MNIEFREFNPFDLWIWLELDTVLSNLERQYLEEIFDSWFLLGKLGAFNAENVQVQDAGAEISYLEYDDSTSPGLAPMHNMGELECEGTWARCWFDLGTSDGIAIDILINALLQFDKDYFPIRQLLIGGENEDWPVPNRRSREGFVDDEWN